MKLLNSFDCINDFNVGIRILIVKLTIKLKDMVHFAKILSYTKLLSGTVYTV